MYCKCLINYLMSRLAVLCECVWMSVSVWVVYDIHDSKVTFNISFAFRILFLILKPLANCSVFMTFSLCLTYISININL